MSEAIRADSIGKRYILRSREQYYTFRDVLAQSVNPFYWIKERGKLKKGDFWALKDVSFDVNQGDSIGIIGKNGAGKSTLLKILSRITLPSEGQIKLSGRVASLLEVGTGFHPELTGRENIFLNGAIFGMSRREIRNKFDQIVEFAEIEKFLDMPVKRYSTGMYMRLAFSVAAHLESDILLVDEVLAVGDAEFQKKCLGKMDTFSRRQGKTLLFVSHNVLAIKKLCNKCLLLDKGSVADFGDADRIINQYIQTKKSVDSRVTWDLDTAPGNNVVKLIECSLRDGNGTYKADFDFSEDIFVSFKINVLEENIPSIHNLIEIFDERGEYVFMSFDTTSCMRGNVKHQKGIHEKVCIIPKNLLAPGVYSVSIRTSTAGSEDHFYASYVLLFGVVENFDSLDEGMLQLRSHYVGPIHGVIRPILKWDSRYLG